MSVGVGAGCLGSGLLTISIPREDYLLVVVGVGVGVSISVSVSVGVVVLLLVAALSSRAALLLRARGPVLNLLYDAGGLYGNTLVVAIQSIAVHTRPAPA